MSASSAPTEQNQHAPSTDGFEIKQRAEFTPNEGARPVRLTVRQDVSAKMGMKKIGRTVYAFEFESSGAITATNSPTTVVGSFAPSENDAALPTTAVAAAAEALLASREGAERSSNGETWDRVVFVHDRYNGFKQLFVNNRLVYSVPKECTDGNMNSWILPLSFGRVLLTLTVKVVSFEYMLTLVDNKEVLFKSRW